MIRKYRWLCDAVLLALLLSLSLLSLLFLLPKGEGKAVEVRIDGELFATYSLASEGRYTLTGKHGSALLVIEGGHAAIMDPTCADKLCAARGALSSAGESAICLPSRIEIRIVGEEGGLDGYA